VRLLDALDFIVDAIFKMVVNAAKDCVTKTQYEQARNDVYTDRVVTDAKPPPYMPSLSFGDANTQECTGCKKESHQYDG